ncbi:putative CheY-like superfamily protein [Rosa chinensis]|uniref:Putative CheY-like superfamily protein n=1 Tax=Rosa chinensis TaxID=74649 RepID=A0A2P6P2U6_ROSCH|nr:putative CheY-like superfamily protein [Rosa chinensis]
MILYISVITRVMLRTVTFCVTVISVGSAVKVVDVLNEEWSSIDIILAAVDLPIESSIEMLKCIMQDRYFKCIPVISRQRATFLY